MPQPTQSPNDWNSYLAMLDLSNPTLAAYLRSVLPNLATAVPPAGEYTTSLDYETLKPALTSQYVSEVLQKYEAILGPSPELYEAAVAQGALTPEQAQAMMGQSSTGVGSLQQQFGAKGGLRALAGPYEAQRTEILKQALADIQTATEKASTDAYNLASQTTGQRVTALSNAGQIGSQLVGHGVSRRNSQGMEGAGEQGPMDLPAPPDRHEPSVWEKILMGALPAGITAGAALLGRGLAPSPPERVNPILQRQKDEEEAAAYREQQQASAGAEERPPGWQGSQGEQFTTSNPYSTDTASYGEAPYGGGQQAESPAYSNVFGTANGWPAQSAPPQQPSYSWQAPQPAFHQPQPQQQSQNNPYSGGGGGGGGNEDYYGGYGYVAPYSGSTDYGTSYQGDYGYTDYNQGYNYDPYSWSGDDSGGYWV